MSGSRPVSLVKLLEEGRNIRAAYNNGINPAEAQKDFARHCADSINL